MVVWKNRSDFSKGSSSPQQHRTLTFDFDVDEFQPGGLLLDEDGDDFDDLFDPNEFDFLSPGVPFSPLGVSARELTLIKRT